MAKRIALTFDAEHADRPTRPGVAESILDTLERFTIRATFFLQGRWVESNPDLTTRIKRAGHLIGSHSFYHARMPLMTRDGFREDVAEAERAIIDACAIDPKPWYRFPFGAGFDDLNLQALLGEAGYRNIHWHVDSLDWDPQRTVAQLENDVPAQVERHGDGAIVLMHSWPIATGQALPRIVARLSESDARFVGVDELGGA